MWMIDNYFYINQSLFSPFFFLTFLLFLSYVWLEGIGEKGKEKEFIFFWLVKAFTSSHTKIHIHFSIRTYFYIFTQTILKNTQIILSVLEIYFNKIYSFLLPLCHTTTTEHASHSLPQLQLQPLNQSSHPQ